MIVKEFKFPSNLLIFSVGKVICVNNKKHKSINGKIICTSEKIETWLQIESHYVFLIYLTQICLRMDFRKGRLEDNFICLNLEMLFYIIYIDFIIFAYFAILHDNF